MIFLTKMFLIHPQPRSNVLGNMRMVKAKMGIFLIRKHHICTDEINVNFAL